ncbi:molybdenum metabolism regulator [Chitinophaga agrisoli]|uniref:Molybdenum metabolism regulator n=1 Tax=Chitinophaga agrisoli TaxID=2607653 RepID=A0A5B2VJJ7_9BACT|nr:STM4015 family protein [Chitinophaga agrisoli]KAA2238417.1 molybdenum metabolism regulator [Chitinophaga agrisoli]
MTVSSNLNTFLNKRVQDFISGSPLTDIESVVYRVSVSYDNEEIAITTLLDEFANDPKAAEVQELIIGMFVTDTSDDSSEVISALITLKDKLKSLRAIFIGEMTYEECEISWIQQSDISPLLNAYPELTHLQVRGGEGLRFNNLHHANLQTLIIETGGFHPATLTDVINAGLPKLERLDLWLGDENYGFNSTVEDLQPIISGSKFPTLKHLGLMDSEIQDGIAIAISQSPILKQLEVLDMSMGTLTDKGAEALLASPGIKGLSFLNLRHHFLSNEMMAKLAALGININLDDQEKPDSDMGGYVEVSE